MKIKRLLSVSCVFLITACSTIEHRPAQHAIASAHPEATQAGLTVMQQGGNAFDAAIALTAALAVVEPFGSGIGGGGFWLLHDEKKQRQVMLDGRETAPLNAHRDMYLDELGEPIPKASVDGPLAAGIPGVPAALVHLATHYGRLPLSKSLQPAIRLAKEGFKVNAHYRELATFRLNALQNSTSAAKIFLKKNQVPALGEVIVQTELAKTLETLAQEGHDGFYRGAVAEKMVGAVQKNGGIWTLEDLAQYQVKEREPIRFRYRETEITSAALPSSGGLVLAIALQTLQHFDLSKYDPATQIHLVVEAMRRAYQDRAQYMGDQDFVDVPTRALLNKRYAETLARAIDEHKATTMPNSSPINLPEGQNTTHFSVLDAEGNRVAATLSINYPFGSGFVAEGTGVLLNDEMDDFSKKPGTPNVYGLIGGEANAIEAGKRMLSSMSPTFFENEKGIGILGTPGGSRIISMVLLAILSAERGESVDQWVSLPRYHHQYLPNQIQVEQGAFSNELRLNLESRGHEIRDLKRQYGNMHAIYWDKTSGRVQAASDPRRHGKALVVAP